MRRRVALVAAIAVFACLSLSCAGSRSSSMYGGSQNSPMYKGPKSPAFHVASLIRDGEYGRVLDIAEARGDLFSEVQLEVLRAWATLRLGDAETASDMYMAMMAAGYLDDSDALYGLYTRRENQMVLAAEAHLRTGRAEEALAVCRLLREDGYDQDPVLDMLVGEASFQQGELTRAKRHFEYALESLDVEHARTRLKQIAELQSASE